MQDKDKILSSSQLFIFGLCGLLVGFFFAPELNLNFNQFLFLIFGLALGLFLVYPKLVFRALGIFWISGIVAAFYFQFWQSYELQKNIQELIGKKIILTGTIAEEIEIGDNSQKIVLGYLEVNKQHYKGKILVYLPKYPRYKFNQSLKISGMIQRPPRFSSFDWRKYLAKEKIYGILFRPQKIEKIERKIFPSSQFFLNFKGVLLAIKIHFLEITQKILPVSEAGLLAGILLGTKSLISKELLQTFNLVGITHIIALSGYNITILVRAFLFLSRNWSRKLSWLLIISGLSAFIILTGASASVLRAGMMAGLLLIAERLGRKAEQLIALLLAGVLLSIFNPLLIRFDVGFQLSFLATAGLIFFAPKILEQNWLKLIPKFFHEYLASTLAALSLTLPILVYYFGRLSLVAPLVNMLVLPIIPATMLVSFLAGILGWIYLGFGEILGLVAYIFLTYIIEVAKFFAQIPFVNIVITKDFANIFFWLYYLLFGFLYFGWTKFFGKKSKIALFL